MRDVTQDANTETESSSAQDANAESSAAETASSETQSKTLLEVVTEAAEKAGSVEESSTPNDEDKEGSVQESNKTKDQDDEEDVAPEGDTEDEEEEDVVKDVPFHDHPRWKEVVSERDTAREKVNEYEARVKELEPIASAHKTVVDYCERNQISPDDYRKALEFVALLKNDPAKAREQLAPVWEGLAQLTGDKLPADLQAEVDNNLLPLQRAQEIAKLRAQSTFETTKHKQTVEQMQQEERQRFVKDAHVALQSWESAHRKTDLDFAPKKNGEANGKYEWYMLEMQNMVATNPPKTPQEFINLAEKAYDSSCKSFSRFTSRNKPSKVMPSTRSSKTKSQEPKTIADVVKQTAARHGLVMDED